MRCRLGCTASPCPHAGGGLPPHHLALPPSNSQQACTAPHPASCGHTTWAVTQRARSLTAPSGQHGLGLNSAIGNITHTAPQQLHRYTPLRN